MRILFVCMGNICRSPTAEGVMRHALQSHSCESMCEIDSAGTHDYHIGAAPDRRTIAAARRRGIDLSNLRARQIVADDFERFDLILAMDSENESLLRQRAPPRFQERIKLVMHYAPDGYAREVPDPYYGGAKGFEEVLDLLEQASQGLLRQIQQAQIARTR